MKVFKTKDSDELSEWDWRDIRNPDGVRAFWYDYHYGCYEGWGEGIVLRVDGSWFRVNLGHCSCYGPLENFEGVYNKASYPTLEALKSANTMDLNNDLKDVLALIDETIAQLPESGQTVPVASG